MELQQLRYAVALSEELHFLKASQKVHVSQPTLSQQIKKLESELGAPLFERATRRVRLTAQGHKFLPYAIQALSNLQRGVEEVRENSDVVSGVIRLGVIPTVCPYLMPELLERLSKTAPKVRIELFEETTPLLLENLKAAKLDLGILALPVKDRTLSVLALHREAFFAAVSKTHALAARTLLRRKDLLNEKLLILREGHCFGDQSMEYCKLTRQDPQIRFQGSSLTSVMAMAEQGQGVTFVPEMARDKSASHRLKFIALDKHERPYRQIGVAWRVSSPLDRAQKVFLQTAEEFFTTKGGSR